MGPGKHSISSVTIRDSYCEDVGEVSNVRPLGAMGRGERLTFVVTGPSTPGGDRIDSGRQTMSFHDLHHRGIPFVLPNAWDVPSALAYVADGFTAVGTTSFGVASSAGHRDGARAIASANAALAAALEPLGCYVSVDIEDGYSDDPEFVADYVAAMSIAGINIEDSTNQELIDPALAAEIGRASCRERV